MQYCRLSCAARCWHTNLKFKCKINVNRLPTIINKAVVLDSADGHEIEQIYTLPVTAEETAKETKADTEVNDVYLALLRGDTMRNPMISSAQ